jgi:hypothetical protein
VDLHGKLEGMGAPIADKDFQTIILSSLPQSYRMIISTITITSSLSKTTIDNNHLIRIITEEVDHRSILQENDSGGGSVLIVTERSGKGKGQQSSTAKKCTKCFNCDKPGHMKADCWAPGGGKEGQGLKQKSGKVKVLANTASSNESSENSPPQKFTFITTVMPTHHSTIPDNNEATAPNEFNQDSPPHKFAFLTTMMPINCSNILVDSGATSHFCAD